jgi:hypothetical protein
MKKISFLMLLTMAFLAITVSLAAAGTNLVSLRNSTGKVISASDFNPAAMSYDDDAIQISSSVNGKFNVAIATSATFHMEGAPNHSIDRPNWDHVEMGLGCNFLTNNKPAIAAYKSVPMLGYPSRDNGSVMLWDNVALPTDGSVFVLTLPARFKGEGSWSKSNSHPWGWISWYNNACLRYGDGQIGYGFRYVAGKFEPVGIANPEGATDARQASVTR